MKNRDKILVISVILAVFIFIPSLLFLGQPPHQPQVNPHFISTPQDNVNDKSRIFPQIGNMTVILDGNTSIFNFTKDITEIPGLEIFEMTPEMWYEHQKKAEERNAIRSEKIKTLLETDADFVNAGKLVEGLNSTNIEDDVYWQTVLEALLLITEKQGFNATISFEESEQLRDLLRP